MTTDLSTAGLYPAAEAVADVALAKLRPDPADNPVDRFVRWLNETQVDPAWKLNPNSIPLLLPGLGEIPVGTGMGLAGIGLASPPPLFSNPSPGQPLGPLIAAPSPDASTQQMSPPVKSPPIVTGDNASSGLQQSSPSTASGSNDSTKTQTNKQLDLTDPFDVPRDGKVLWAVKPGYQPAVTYSSDLLSTGYIDHSDPNNFGKSQDAITGDLAALLKLHAHIWILDNGAPAQVTSIDEHGMMHDDTGRIQHVSQLISDQNSNADVLRIELPQKVQVHRQPGTAPLSTADALANQSASDGGAFSPPTTGTAIPVALTQQPGQPAGATTPTPTGLGATPPAPGVGLDAPTSGAGDAPLPLEVVNPETLTRDPPDDINSVTELHSRSTESKKKQTPSAGEKPADKKVKERETPYAGQTPDDKEMTHIDGSSAEQDPDNGSVWDKDHSGHAESDWKRYKNRKAWEKRRDPESVRADGSVR